MTTYDHDTSMTTERRRTQREHDMGIGKKSKHLGEMAGGKVKEVIGKVRGDTQVEQKGKAEQIKGKMKQAVERGKHPFKH
ncbi:CsbD family protein [Streptomyces sp. NPDC059008]|uniref:CsbD family protein n=1 Tax=unclassified Streptomyces TaxID=2593676 RepID=UPI0036AEDEB6